MLWCLIGIDARCRVMWYDLLLKHQNVLVSHIVVESS